jgi:hypothetical protein
LLVWCGAEGYVSGLQDAAIKTSVASSWHFISTYFHIIISFSVQDLNIQKKEGKIASLVYALSTFNSAHTQIQDQYVKRNGDKFHVTRPRDETDMTCELHVPLPG